MRARLVSAPCRCPQTAEDMRRSQRLCADLGWPAQTDNLCHHPALRYMGTDSDSSLVMLARLLLLSAHAEPAAKVLAPKKKLTPPLCAHTHRAAPAGQASLHMYQLAHSRNNSFMADVRMHEREVVLDPSVRLRKAPKQYPPWKTLCASVMCHCPCGVLWGWCGVVARSVQ